MKVWGNFGYNMDAAADFMMIFRQEELDGHSFGGCGTGSGHQLLLLLGGVLQSGTSPR
jgi:hypothetical protein